MIHVLALFLISTLAGCASCSSDLKENGKENGKEEKPDILARARAENQGGGEYEKQVLEKAGRLAAQAGLLFLGLFNKEIISYI